jgi:hypothetical protein
MTPPLPHFPESQTGMTKADGRPFRVVMGPGSGSGVVGPKLLARVARCSTSLRRVTSKCAMIRDQPPAVAPAHFYGMPTPSAIATSQNGTSRDAEGVFARIATVSNVVGKRDEYRC